MRQEVGWRGVGWDGMVVVGMLQWTGVYLHRLRHLAGLSALYSYLEWVISLDSLFFVTIVVRTTTLPSSNRL